MIITPGQDMMLVMSGSLTQGAAAGVATAAGVSVGLLGHTVLATIGLGAILQASEWLFRASAQRPTLSVFAPGVAFAVLTFVIKGPVGIFAGGPVRLAALAARGAGLGLPLERRGKPRSQGSDASRCARSRRARRHRP